MRLLPLLLALPLAAQIVSLKPNSWTASTNTNRVLNPVRCGTSLCVDFPTPATGKTINYLTTKANLDLTGKNFLTLTAQLNVTGTPVFLDYDPSNTGTLPPSARPYLEQSGALTGSWSCATFDPRWYGRWWSNPTAYDLAQGGLLTMTIPLDPVSWSSVCGQFGSDTPAATAGFRAALAHVTAVGLTFGKGFYFGHGLYTGGGTATLQVIHYEFF